MGQARRRTPAIPERPGRPVPRPQFLAFPEFGQPAAPAHPGIGCRYGRTILSWDEWSAWARPQYVAFHEFDRSQQPAFPVIGSRHGRPVLADAAPFVLARFFPLVVPPAGVPAAASPGIPFVSGPWRGDAVQALDAAPRFLPFPFVSAAEAPAPPSGNTSPEIRRRRRRS